MPAMSIVRRQGLRPQNRDWSQVVEMLKGHLDQRPMFLLCQNCNGEHVCIDPNLVVHCKCGVTTKFENYVLFHSWTSLTWGLLLLSQRGNVVDCYNPLRQSTGVGRKAVPLRSDNPQQPMDGRVCLWRHRSAMR